MKARALYACVLLLAASALAQSKGIKPRPNPDGFPASAQTETVVIGAAQLSASQVGHTFASPELGKGYIVVEIALYPKNGELKLDPANFTLAIESTKTVLHAASPQAIAAVLQKPGGRDVTLYEVQPKLANMAEVLITDAPPPGQVLKVISSILAGGFPFDNTRDFK